MLGDSERVMDDGGSTADTVVVWITIELVVVRR